MIAPVLSVQYAPTCLLPHAVDGIFHRNSPIFYLDRPCFEVAGLNPTARMSIVHPRQRQQQQEARQQQARRRKGSFQHL